MWTDPTTKQREFAWAADAMTVIWVYGIGLSDKELETIVKGIEVSPL